MPGLVRPISTAVPLQFNNNNSVHVVNTSLPVYSPPSNYGLNLSSKTAEAKPDVKDIGKPGFDHAAGHQNATNSSRKKKKEKRLSMSNIYIEYIWKIPILTLLLLLSSRFRWKRREDFN